VDSEEAVAALASAEALPAVAPVAASATEEVEVALSAVVLPVEAAVRPEVVAAAPEEALDAVALVPAPRFSLCPTIVSREFSFCAVKTMLSSLRT